jgi:hypothetical protein
LINGKVEKSRKKFPELPPRREEKPDKESIHISISLKEVLELLSQI